MQFLSNVLSQRGPTSLPYSEDTKWLIRQHLLSLSDSCPSLQPKTAIFTHNDGRTVNLLQADGTIPIIYNGVTYNIPIIIWLVESYPRHPPLVFVNPTRDMIIKRPHPNVTPSGSVSIPYLQNWIYPSSNLVDLVRNLSHCFGKDPPLYSQRRPHPSQGQSLSQSTNPSFGHGQNPSSSFGSGSVGGPGRVFPPSPYVGSSRIFPPSPQRPGAGVAGGVGLQTDDPNEVFRRNATNKIVEMVHGDIVGLRKAREGEMDGLFNAQGALRVREGELKKGVKEMMDEKEGLEQQLQMVLMNADVLEEWLRENKEKLGKMDSVDVDNAFEPCDGISKQLIEVSALDLAIEDVIYSLDKAVQDGTIPFDQYLKNVRLLSREQFFHRALAMKIRGVQMQAHVSSMAARTSQYTL